MELRVHCSKSKMDKTTTIFYPPYRPVISADTFHFFTKFRLNAQLTPGTMLGAGTQRCRLHPTVPTGQWGDQHARDFQHNRARAALRQE